MTTSERPFLPSLQAILLGDRRSAGPCSPLLDSMKSRFHSDNQGVIRLPPLHTSMPRPRSVDSALRHTAVAALVDTEIKISPSTPLPKTKTASSASRRSDVLTPLSAARAIITPSTNDKKRAFAFITHSQETFPKKEPKIDNAPLARRKRRRTSTQELNILQAEFDLCPAPDKHKRQELADRCNMSVKAIQIWFQNKRQSSKKQRIPANKLLATVAVGEPIEADSENNIKVTTPLANKIMQTPETQRPFSNDLSIVLPEERISPTKSDTGNTTPTRATPPSKRGQALTFHLTSDKKLLTPIKTSPNTRVNRLINGTSDIASPFRNRSRSSSKSRLEHKKIPLRELSTNTLVH